MNDSKIDEKSINKLVNNTGIIENSIQYFTLIKSVLKVKKRKFKEIFFESDIFKKKLSKILLKFKISS